MTKEKDFEFLSSVLEIVCHIPKGRVTTYGAIARALGSSKSSRLVGTILSRTAKSSIPAHRVINRNGVLTGKHHFGTPDVMAHLLMQEGVCVKDNQVVNFKALFWDPMSLSD